jgi:hypothetical protein
MVGRIAGRLVVPHLANRTSPRNPRSRVVACVLPTLGAAWLNASKKRRLTAGFAPDIERSNINQEPSKEASASVSPPPPSGAALLSRQMYELARSFTADMLQDKQPKSSTFSPSISFPLAVVILSLNCLEAYLNEFLALREHADQQEWGAAISELQRANLQAKWALASRLLAGKSFDKGGEPYQSFSLLCALRNELVHYHPEFRPMGTFPSGKIESLKSKFAFAFPGRADWTVQVLNPECAKWACRTVRVMIRTFHELVGGPDFTVLPPPWSDPP